MDLTRIRLPRAAVSLLHHPVGIIGRHRPFYFLNLLDRARGPQTLESAVSGRVVLVTGASSGIGEATARRLAGAGAIVLLVARRADNLEALRAEIARDGGAAEVHPCDLFDTAATEDLTAAVLAGHGRVDVLVNNAGKSIRRSIALSYDRFQDFERTIQLNYLAAVRLTLAFLPGMRGRGDGHIVNVSTAGVPVRVPRFSGYIASKAALEAFSDCVAGEAAHDGVRFTSVQMPLVRTPMIRPTGVYRSFPALTPAQAADRICQAIVHRPRRVGTPYGDLAAMADVFSPASVEAVRSAGYRLSGDSRAARR
jgi:short-subunit dehydrogenase